MVWRLPASLSLLLLFVNFEMIGGLSIFRFAVVFVSFENDMVLPFFRFAVVFVRFENGIGIVILVCLCFVSFDMIWGCQAPLVC